MVASFTFGLLSAGFDVDLSSTFGVDGFAFGLSALLGVDFGVGFSGDFESFDNGTAASIPRVGVEAAASNESAADWRGVGTGAGAGTGTGVLIGVGVVGEEEDFGLAGNFASS